jgi:hypothetical protein
VRSGLSAVRSLNRPGDEIELLEDHRILSVDVVDLEPCIVYGPFSLSNSISLSFLQGLPPGRGGSNGLRSVTTSLYGQMARVDAVYL